MNPSKYGVETLKSVVGSVAEVLNVASKVLHNGGIFALFGLTGPITTLQHLDWAAVKQELADLDPAERLLVEKAFSDRLALQDAAVQAKLLAGEGFLEEAVELVESGVGLFNKGSDLVKRVRAYFGV
jgi:hypothetical protein